MIRCLGLIPVVLAGAVVTACASSPLPEIKPAGDNPQLSSPVASQSLPPASASSSKAAPAASASGLANAAIPAIPTNRTAQQEMIVGLKKDTIVLYRDESGFDGERVVAASFSLPIAARPAGNARRLEVLTAAGVRWVERAEVVVNTPPP